VIRAEARAFNAFGLSPRVVSVVSEVSEILLSYYADCPELHQQRKLYFDDGKRRARMKKHIMIMDFH
jgi:hypothetical protein